MTRDAELGPELDARLSYLLKRALLGLDELLTEHLAPHGLGPRELVVLLFLDGREPESQQRTAERLGVDRTTMVGLLDGLETKGLVARRPDAEDRRRNVVLVTAAGRRTLARARAASDAAERRFFGDLSERDVRKLRELLGRVGADRRAG